MAIGTPTRYDPTAPTRWLAAAAGLCCALSLAGCGSGVANVLPNAAAPTSGVPTGAVLGYVFSPTDGTLRALLGVRGSAQVSASLVPAGVYVAGDASSAGSSALLEDASGSLFAFNLPQSQSLHVADGMPANAHIVLASSGRTAIVYAAGGSSLALVTGLPSAAQVQAIPLAAGTTIASAVVSDSGAIAMVSSATPAGVGALSANGQFSRIATVSAASSINFVPGTENLLIADSAANTVSLVRSINRAAALQTLTVTGLNQPAAIAASQDGHWAIIANGGDAALLRVDLSASAATTRIACACQPSQLNALSGGLAFRVNALYGGPLWTLDLSSATPQMLFVPAIARGSR